MKTLRATFAIIVLSLAWSLQASQDHPAPIMPAAFETMKKLLGHWEGAMQEGDQQKPVAITYELTSGGTAVKQTMMPGTAEEMVTLYHKSGDSLAMTHYCTMGNQPFMVLQGVSDSSISFAMEQPVGITSAKEPHMHAVNLSLNSDGTLREEWVYYADDKEVGRILFALSRKP